MVSLIFLHFFPVFHADLLSGTRESFRNLLLFFGSLIFYAWGEPVYVILMLFSQ